MSWCHWADSGVWPSPEAPQAPDTVDTPRRSPPWARPRSGGTGSGQRAPGTGTTLHRPRRPQEMAAASARPYIARRAGTSRAGLVRSMSPAVPLARTARAAL